MKRRNLITILMMFAVVLVLTACSSDLLVGKYVLVNVLDDPEGTTFTELEQMYKVENQKITDHFYMEFESNGKFVLVIAGDEDARGIYLVSDKTLTLTSGGVSVQATFKDGKITYNYETGAKLVFQKPGLSVGAIIAIIAGSVVFLCAAGFCVYRFVIRKKKTV